MRRGCFEERVSPEFAGPSTPIHVAETVSCEAISRSRPVRPSGSTGQRADQPVVVSACPSIRHFNRLGDPPTRRRWTRHTLLLKTCLLLVGLASSWACAQTRAAGYKFQIIAQPGDVIDGQTIMGFSDEDNPIAINNSREVVFMAGLGDPYRLAIMTPDRLIAGAGKLVDGVVPRFSDEDHRLSINDAGQVAYAAFYDDSAGLPYGEEAVFLDDKILVGTDRGDLVDGKPIQGVSFKPVINNQGTVAFVARHDSGLGVTLSTQDGVVTAFGDDLDGGRLGNIFIPQINDAGTIAFTSGFFGKNNAMIFTQDGLLVESGETVPGPDGTFNVNTVIDGRIIGGDIKSFGISDSDEVAFWAVISSPSGSPVGPFEQGMFTQNRLLVETGTIVDGRRIQRFKNGRQFNASGMFSYLAYIPDGQGLFVDNQLVIETGEAIEGRTVTDFQHIVGMNDRGDLAFLARFEDGGSAIVMATIPEPSTLLLGDLLVLKAHSAVHIRV
ncbi:MAG: choice-of-anchor tandem repeat NxxGxxAF-containing protein, partial [Pirellulales bacterium]